MKIKGDGSVDHDSGLGTSKHKSIGSNLCLLHVYIEYLMSYGHTDHSDYTSIGYSISGIVS